MRTRTLFLGFPVIVGIILFVTGCTQPLSTREKGVPAGVGLGAATGAIIGSAVGSPGAGAAIGGALGGVDGGACGRSTATARAGRATTAADS